MNKRTEKLIANYFDGQISEQEFSELFAWIEKGNINVFNEYVTLNFSIEQIKIAQENNEAASWDRIASKINSRDSGRVISFYRKRMFKYAVAASIALLISLTFVFNKNSVNEGDSIIVDNNIEVGTDKATLTLQDGTNITLEKGQNYIANNITSNGEKIVYETPNTAKEQIAYNYLTIPRGGQYHVKLEDGTEVWLNSESQLKYPVNFIDGETRQVELVYGEAYFDVSPSSNHNGSRFKVLSNKQEVEVLGTEFNIKAYKDETMVYTTLVEGKVKVKTDTQNRVLAPNQQSIVDINNKNIEIANSNVRNEVAWVNGEFILQHKNLKEIMKVLSRWYDMDVTFANEELENERFVGVLGKEQNIVDILNIIKSFGVINSYEINNKKVILK